MNKLPKLATGLSLAFGFLFLSTAIAFAAGGNGGDVYGGGGCVPVYGGGTSCPPEGEQVNKTVKNPGTGEFVDALGPEHPVNTRFIPGQDVVFRIQIKNNSNQTISHIDVVDTLPLYTSFVSGPGSYNATNKTINYSIDNLSSQATNEQFVTVRTNAMSELPNDKSLLCGREGVKNIVNIVADGRAPRFDETPFCIAKPSTPITTKKIPAAGAESIILPGLISFLAGGLYLWQKAKAR